MARLPPLNALRAFHAAAQTRSLAGAAQELGVTPQAIGQQIRLLESALATTLFDRRGRSLELTESGILLSHFVKAGFDEIAEGVRRVSRGRERERINVNASPYFASRYLMPALNAYREVAPQIEIRLSTIIDLPDFSRDEIDIAIQWGYGGWPGLESKLLIADPKVICCAPQLAKTIRKPEDLARATLLDAYKSKRLWPDIFRHLGLAAPAERKIGFDDAATMRRATLQGLGVGLVSEIEADEDIGAGALVAPLGRAALAGMTASDIPGFHLLAPRAALRAPAVQTFHRWLLKQDWRSLATPPAPRRRR